MTSKSASAPSSNWEKLKKKLPAEAPKPQSKHIPAHSKRSKNGFSKGLGAFKNALAEESSAAPSPEAGPSRPPAKEQYKKVEGVMFLPSPSDKPLLNELRSMVAGLLPLNEAKKAPGNYVAIDCEMVGLGHLGSESALARVSLVNYHGHIVLDTFVQPREKVTDWRTWVSGVRESDMVGAPSFEEVQKQVAALIEGRILIGHAVENDMKSLLLSHPNPLLRDTQKCKQLRERAKTKRPGLKKLTESELGLKIQAGSHSSVTDARATMALYRLVKPEWEASLRSVMETYREKTGMAPLAKGGKRKRQDGAGEDDEAEGATNGKRGKKEAPGGGRKGISSGLSVVVRRFGKKVEDEQPKRRGPAAAAKASTGGSWWEEAAG